MSNSFILLESIAQLLRDTPQEGVSDNTFTFLRPQNIRENIVAKEIYFCIFMLMVYIVSNMCT